MIQNPAKLLLDVGWRMRTKNKSYSMKTLSCVQYGCGMSAPSGWRNFDSSPTLRFERVPFIGKFYTKNESRFPRNVEYGDIVKGLPVAAESCHAVYCSHVLEHLSLDDFRIALKNTYRILAWGGVFRLVLPDLEYHAKQYLNDPSSEASLIFMKATLLGCESRERSFKGIVTCLFGNSKHLWMWDHKSVKYELSCAGFCEIRKAVYGDSIEEKFMEVEDRSRWENCVGYECRKAAKQMA